MSSLTHFPLYFDKRNGDIPLIPKGQNKITHLPAFLMPPRCDQSCWFSPVLWSANGRFMVQFYGQRRSYYY
jgi:hypothetical protein